MSNNNNKGISKNDSSNLFGIILLCISVLIILYFIYSILKGYSNYNKYSPYLIHDVIGGSTTHKIKSYKIPQPLDGQYGTEYTYTFWIFVKDSNFDKNCDTSSEGAFKHIFHRGSLDHSSTSLPLLQNPGVWLYPNTNKLNIRFNTFQNVTESCDVGNIPLGVWTHVTVLLIGNSVDVFINGNLKKRQKLRGVPKLNYENLYITNWNGFDGYLCKTRYFNYAIQPFMIEYLYKEGPSTKFDSSMNKNMTVPTLSPDYWMTLGYPNTTGEPSISTQST